MQDDSDGIHAGTPSVGPIPARGAVGLLRACHALRDLVTAETEFCGAVFGVWAQDGVGGAAEPIQGSGSTGLSPVHLCSPVSS